MKSYIKTCVLLLAVSMLTFSCDKKNNDTPNDPTKDAADEIAVTADNLEGEWVLVGWACSDGSDMSHTLGKKIIFFTDGTMYMTTEEWEDLMPIYSQWTYSKVNNTLIFSAEGEESITFSVKSFTGEVLSVEFATGVTHMLTFEKQ